MKQNYHFKSLPAVKLSGIFLACLSLFLFVQTANAQLSGWKYRDAIRVSENAGIQNLNYQVLLTINTASLIGANKMNANGDDIRFSKDCAGSVLLNYFIDAATINTSATKIWVMLDTLQASGQYSLNMWYGNSTATAASSFNNTFPVSTQLIVSTGTVTLTGTNTYSWFEVASGAGLIITPGSPLVINSRVIKINGSILGNGSGYLGGQTSQNGSGPGPGLAGSLLETTSGGGGAYGGNGGQGNVAAGTNGDGGVAYGNTTTIDMGSGGGGPAGVGAGATDGNGGGALTLNAREVIITGSINLNGNNGTNDNMVGFSGGGGAGGGLLLRAYNTVLTGTITAIGGNGGGVTGDNAGGGGGGGGRVNLYSEISFTPGTYNVAGGLQGVTTNTNNPPADPGMPGVVATGTYAANEPTYTVYPHVVLSSSTFPICQGSNASFTASGGFNPYNFYVNGDSVQFSTSNTYATNNLNNNDTILVLAGDVNGCLDTSNMIMATVNALPTATVTPAMAICVGNSVPLSAGGGVSYNWAPSTGLSSTSGPNVTASPTVTTTYTVMVTDNNSCQDWDTVTVTVNICTGIATTHATQINLYPNPAHQVLIIDVTSGSAEKASVTIENMLGEIVIKPENSTNGGSFKMEISLSSLPGGVYFVRLNSIDGTKMVRFIKN